MGSAKSSVGGGTNGKDPFFPRAINSSLSIKSSSILFLKKKSVCVPFFDSEITIKMTRKLHFLLKGVLL